MRYFLIVGLLFLMTCGAGAELTTPTFSGERALVYKVDLKEGITSTDVPFFIHRALVAAKANRADAIVLDVDTPGGRLDLMMQIRDEIIEVEVPTYAYINKRAISAGSLIAIACDKIVMAPFSSIGGAQVITGTGQALPETVEQKMNSILKSEVRATAKYKNHPVRVCEAFVDRNVEIPGLTPEGEVLTMDQEEATGFEVLADPSDPMSTTTLAAFIAKDVEDLLAKEGYGRANIMHYEMSWSEKLAKFLMSIKGVILLIGLGALFMEAKTPGLGVPGAIGVIALSLFFWSSYLADMAEFFEVILFVLGFGLLMLEIFVIPGFGVAGVAGVVCVIASLVLAMMQLPPADVPGLQLNTGLMNRAIWTVVFVFVGMVPVIWLTAKLLPSTPLFRYLVLDPKVVPPEDAKIREARQPAGTRFQEPLEEKELVGQVGVALTDLRPAGKVKVQGRKIDVVTEGEYVEQGRQVRIIDVHGNISTVESVDENG